MLSEQEQYLEDKYGVIREEDIHQDEDGVFMVLEDEFDSEQGGIGKNYRKAYFKDKDLPLLEELGLISL